MAVTPEERRAAIRNRILSAKAVRKPLNLFGMDVEVKQPTVNEVLKIREGDNPTKFFVEFMINSVYVPGTNDKVFSDADAEALAELPFGPEFDKINQVVLELTSIDVESQEKN